MFDKVKNTYVDTLKDHETGSCIMSYSGRWIAFFHIFLDLLSFDVLRS